MAHADSLLRGALRANALFSTACALTFLVGGGALAPALGIPSLALRGVGAALLPFAVGLWHNAGRDSVSRTEAWTAVGLDLAWVAGSAALVVGALLPLTAAGRWTVIGIAEAVLLWAVLQTVGLIRSAPRATHAH